MQISEKQMYNLQDKIIYKPAFQRQKMVTPISLPYCHTNKSPLPPPVDRLSNTRCRSNGPYLISSEMSGSRIISSLSFAQI